MKNTKQLKKGFTLVELLVVIAMIVGLMAILVPVVGSARNKAVKLRAKNDCTTLTTSVAGYYDAYNILPASESNPPSEDTEVETTDPIMSVLAGENIDDLNKKEITFGTYEDAKGSSEASAYAGLWQDSEGATLYDPWKKKAGATRGYVMLLDYDYDEKLDNPFLGGRVLARRVVVWSTGKDGQWRRGKPKVGVNEDNVYSWQ